MSPRARWALAGLLVLLACGVAQGKAVLKAYEAAGSTPGDDTGKAQQGHDLSAAWSEEGNGDNGEEPLCSNTVNSAKSTGLGSCQQAPTATRAAAAAAGGAGLGPDDASRYMSIDEAKAAALKQLQDAKADPLAAFAKWLADNKKAYTADSEEGKRVFARFLEVIETGIKHNSDPETLYAVGLTSQLDRSLEGRPSTPQRRSVRSLSEAVPKSYLTCSLSLIDNRNTLNAAQSTGNKCFSDWAFAVTAAMQAQAYLSSNTLLPNLSAQQLVDCSVSSSSSSGTNKGCVGGQVDVALDYAQREGVMAESDYPYEMTSYRYGDSYRKTCRASTKTSSRRYTISGFDYLNGDEEQMRMALCSGQAGAILVEMNACDALFNYRGGILTSDCAFESYSDEAYDNNLLPFAIVGYGTAKVGSTNVPYWLVRAAWGSSWGDSSYPGHFRIKRGAGLAGITFNPITINSVSLKSDAAKCTTSTSWTPGMYSAWKRTSYNNYWAVAATGACNQYGYSYNKADKASAEKSALDACTAGFKVPCAIMRSGQAVCTNATRIAELKAWAEGRAQPGQVYAVAINGTCGTGYGRWSNSNWTYVNDAVKDCNTDMASKYGTTASGPCGILLSGKKPTAPVVTKCTDSSKWQSSRSTAISKTYWGYYWSVSTDPRCGNQYYIPNLSSLEAAKTYYSEGCNAAAKPTFGSNACSVVDYGLAQCTDSSTWQSTVALAKEKTSFGRFWAVFTDKLCKYRWYSYNYASYDAVRAAPSLSTCNNNATARGLSSSSCGMVAYGQRL